MTRTLLLLPVLLLATNASGDDRVYDVVVYGGTSGGITAAVQTARMGKSVILIEPGRYLGGLTTGGLGATDIGNKQAIGGIAREFYRQVRRHYAQAKSWQHETLPEYQARKKTAVDDDTMWMFEPHVATAIYRDMIAAAKVPVVLSQRLDLAAGVIKQGTRLTALKMESGEVYRGRMFIDATYEGDVMAKAGVSYTVGREANAEFNETLNGMQVGHAVKHQFTHNVDPYVRPGDKTSGLLPGVHGDPLPPDGTADHRVQAYCFRLCTTDVPENRVPWPKPADYDPLRYELVLRNCEAGDLRIPWNPVWMPNRKTDTNNNFAISTDNLGMNYAYPDGDYATREKIIAEHESYQKGLLWTLANSPRVPEKVRTEFQRLGLAKDEFTETGNWPNQLYVREARRMRGEYVMTEHNCRGDATPDDAVGMGAYGMDSHNTQRYVDANGFARNEGDVQVGGFSPYPISYRSIVPKAAQCTNLFVPVCLSATHIAYGSIRMEPVFMVLGQSSATAAVLALDTGVDVQRVDYAALRKRLLADHQILEWTGPKRKAKVAIRKEKPAGIVIDDAGAVLTGEWQSGATFGPYIDAGYQHDSNKDKAGKTARFETRLPNDGIYEVRFAYSESANRTKALPITVVAADGEHTVTINQQQKPADPPFQSLGKWPFTAKQPAVVIVRCAGTQGHVLIDAVQFLPQSGPGR